MLANVAIYTIKPQFVDEFRKRMLIHAATCLRDEPGCKRFDVNQSREDPTVFLMYELFVDETAAEAHKTTAHIADFVRRRDGEGWLAGRTIYLTENVFLSDTR